MKLVIQRVTRASVVIDEKTHSSIGKGLLLLLGIEQGDGLDQVNHLASKVSKLRLWPDLKDSKKQWASSVVDNGFELMVVSQFTLFATFKKPKPDFHQAMGGSEAEGLYEAFVGKCRSELSPGKVSTGSFGAMMNVELCNDGPVTVELLSAPVGAANTAPSVAPSASGSASAAPSASPTARAADGAELEERLEEKPYLGGYFPTAEDAEYFAKLSHGGLPRSSPNLLRWYEHVASFSERERSLWAG
ncbi:D-tyrosyl-tRNA(Tyr) deacylase 1 [Symbiodinium microadriaticum]|uniref:D-aminoacyl-tRNA deacylase n=1 Tax=Symbiodinium microadriaticum TaxID=2951 RepID=A0A1Q9DK33_SYMMI|nr:D-tyrosyl-tRNA(Tyr) deacylase 1 [Symbiodinium microadriaticum]CAE7453173.1 Dtd1 [Symbiodinium sp. KB8]CAE7460372.1 Dtd1 [Symbiodinium microadriaticum]